MTVRLRFSSPNVFLPGSRQRTIDPLRSRPNPTNYREVWLWTAAGVSFFGILAAMTRLGA